MSPISKLLFNPPADPTLIILFTLNLSVNICVVLAAFTFPTPHLTNTIFSEFIFPL